MTSGVLAQHPAATLPPCDRQQGRPARMYCRTPFRTGKHTSRHMAAMRPPSSSLMVAPPFRPTPWGELMGRCHGANS
ncbi:hypothetical protein AB2K96_002046 [Yersinia enterocolitica]|nr:hypothetical protein [Yersinia enterocolitica]